MAGSSKIQKHYWTSHGMIPGLTQEAKVDGNTWIHTIALEAQAEEHRKDLPRVRKSRDEWMRKNLCREKEINRLKSQHAKELAEHETKLALIERVHKDEIAFFEAQREGEPALKSARFHAAEGRHGDNQQIEYLHSVHDCGECGEPTKQEWRAFLQIRVPVKFRRLEWVAELLNKHWTGPLAGDDDA